MFKLTLMFKKILLFSLLLPTIHDLTSMEENNKKRKKHDKDNDFNEKIIDIRKKIRSENPKKEQIITSIPKKKNKATNSSRDLDQNLFSAVDQENYKEIKKLLEAGANPLSSLINKSAFHHAMNNDNLKIVTLFTNHYKNNQSFNVKMVCESRDYKSRNIFDIALLSSSLNCIEYVIDIFSKQRNWTNLFCYVFIYSYINNDKQNKWFDLIENYLKKNKTDINTPTKNSKRTPLHAAVECQSEKLVKLLLDHGTRVDAQDDDKKTPIDLALSMMEQAKNKDEKTHKTMEKILGLFMD